MSIHIYDILMIYSYLFMYIFYICIDCTYVYTHVRVHVYVSDAVVNTHVTAEWRVGGVKKSELIFRYSPRPAGATEWCGLQVHEYRCVRGCGWVQAHALQHAETHCNTLQRTATHCV